MIVFPFRLFDDPFGIDPRKLDRNRRIAFLTNPNCTNTRRPVAATAKDFLSFAARNRSLDRAVIQRRQSFRVQPAQRFNLGHQR